VTACASKWVKLARLGLVAGGLMIINPEAVLAQSADQPASHLAQPSVSETSPTHPPTSEGLMSMDDRTSLPGAAEMKAAQALTTKVLAIGSWTAKATPEKRPQIMPSRRVTRCVCNWPVRSTNGSPSPMGPVLRCF
jgi:hypothetical protein